MAHWHKGTKGGVVARVRLSIDVDPELKRRVRMSAAAQDITVRQWIERAIAETLEREEDHSWLESDLSSLGEYEPYEWQEGELEQGDPVRYVPGRGYVVVIEESKPDDGDKNE